MTDDHGAGRGAGAGRPQEPALKVLGSAWILDPKEGQTRSRWQFALGHAF